VIEHLEGTCTSTSIVVMVLVLTQHIFESDLSIKQTIYHLTEALLLT